MSTPQHRRPVVEPDTPVVVNLKDYVDVQINAVDRRVDAVESQSAHAMTGLREDLASFKNEMRAALRGMLDELARMREQDARNAGSLSAFQKLGVFLVGLVATLAPVASLIVALTK